MEANWPNMVWQREQRRFFPLTFQFLILGAEYSCCGESENPRGDQTFQSFIQESLFFKSAMLGFVTDANLLYSHHFMVGHQ